MHKIFPDPDLAFSLLPHAFDARDAAHDEGHLRRVWCNVERIVAKVGGDLRVLSAATILHDCVWVDKASPERTLASRMAASKAREVLADLDLSTKDIEAVVHAVEAHSYSARVVPLTLEAKVLQDADRLDAIGFIGVARCLALAGARGAAIYDPDDPRADARPLDDTAYALDHFQTKLLGLGAGMQTETGRALARARQASLRQFYEGLLAEVDEPG